MNQSFGFLTLAYIFVGGGIGSLLRYTISYMMSKYCSTGAFPIGTFLVNGLGCLLIGYFAGIFLKEDSVLKFLLITGFCGGFTTFSTFSLENYNLWQQGEYFYLSLYVFLSIVIGLLATMLGFYLGKS